MHGDLAPQKLEEQAAQSKIAHGETEQSAQVTQSGQSTLSAKSSATGKVAGQDADFFDSLLWDEFNPSIINVDASLFCASGETQFLLDKKTVRTGLRELSSEGRKLFINGRRIKNA